jgi:hypothetical protein
MRQKSIIIKPESNILKDKLYILKLSGRIMSEKGRSLRGHLVYIFERHGNKLSFYKGFVGAPRTAPETLPIQKSYWIPAMFIISSVVLVASYLNNITPGLLAGTVIILVAVALAVIEGISGYGKSHKEYLRGAKMYNQGFFTDAAECFERAIRHSPGNKYAKYALDAAIIKSAERR